MAGMRFHPFKVPNNCGECGWHEHCTDSHYTCGMVKLLKGEEYQVNENVLDDNCPLKNFDCEEYMRSTLRLIQLVGKMPEDTKVMVRVRKNYGDGRVRVGLEHVEKFTKTGKMLIIECSTKV